MKQKVKIGFVGDVSITGVFKNNIKNNVDIFDEKIKKRLTSFDFVVANLEGPVTNNKQFIRNNGIVNSPFGSLDYLSNANIKIFNLANNHLFDNGLLGFTDTKKRLDKNNCNYFGGGKDINEASKILYIKKKNITFALLGLCHNEGMIADQNKPGVFCLDFHVNVLKEKIIQARKKADWIILNYHGGEEFTTIPMPSRRRLLHKLSKLDVDLIIAHHSHVVQGFENINGKYIFYSLGNFIFDIKKHFNKNLVNNGVILSIEFTKDNFNFKFIPTILDKNLGLVTEGEKEFIDIIKKVYSNFTNYRYDWIKDAHRAFLNSEKNIKSVKNINIGKRHKNFYQLLFEKNTFLKFYNLLKKPNMRPLFIGAILYKINKKK